MAAWSCHDANVKGAENKNRHRASHLAVRVLQQCREWLDNVAETVIGRLNLSAQSRYDSHGGPQRILMQGRAVALYEGEDGVESSGFQ